jgi:hypothetical protein
MPYFVRQPYVPVRALRAADDPSGGIDILELAKDVLASELDEGEKRPFRIRDPIQPGGRGTMVLELALDRDLPTRTISFAASDLVSAGSRIDSDAVRIAPSSLTLPTGGSADITVTIQVPPDARPGFYAGTVSATGDEIFAIPVQVEVRRPD